MSGAASWSGKIFFVQLTALLTPAVVIDRTRARRNIQTMQAAASGRGLRLRPHAKTHKSPLVGRWQLDAGAAGIACAKLGEAEVFADAGFTDIRLPYPLNPSNAPRVLSLLARGIRVSFILDHLAIARAWAKTMSAAGREVEVLVKVDVGFHRCGIDPHSADASAFVVEVARMKGLKLCGLLSHAGHGYLAASEAELETIADDEARLLRHLAAAARARGVAIDEISVGATPTARFSLDQQGITELRPGNYVYFDRTQVGLGAATLDDCALTVVTTVVSKPAPDRVILDCGSKTLSSDVARGIGATAGYGIVFGDLDAARPDSDLVIDRLSEEHAVVKVLSGSTRLEPGDRVRVLPNHSCVVSNLVSQAWLVEGRDVVGPLPVAAAARST
jgi:D-serine deaminase-like pyridoxal phosphate-dependent protein